MSGKTWLILLLAGGLTVSAYMWHSRSMGKLEGEIKARGESIKQLSQLAAQKQQAFQKARAVYIKTPTLESCSMVLLTCEERHSVDSTQNELLSTQIAAQNKLLHKQKLFGLFPRPTLIVGACLDQRLKPALCLAGGFSILK